MKNPSPYRHATYTRICLRCGWFFLALNLLLVEQFLELTNVGAETSALPLFAEKYSVWPLVIRVGIAVLLGLVIALPYRRRAGYAWRASLMVPLMVCGLAYYYLAGMAAFHFGITEPYNALTALRDIRRDNVRLFSYGMPAQSLSPEATKARDAIFQHYHVRVVHAGCIITPGLLRYNEMVEAHLRNINGTDWQERMNKELEALNKAHFRTTTRPPGL
ncbi:MAG: hypothetical protein INR69_09935 [Mucilaginibacter polytrichastri]|nr:hypothetical protein [Mucilaginibacter polytrichastri]